MSSESSDSVPLDESSSVPPVLLCVEYPGKVQNVESMLSTLGGLDTIAKVAGEHNRRMELRSGPKVAHASLQ